MKTDMFQYGYWKKGYVPEEAMLHKLEQFHTHPQNGWGGKLIKHTYFHRPPAFDANGDVLEEFTAIKGWYQLED